MRALKVTLLIMTIAVLTLNCAVNAQNIFVWDHDNDPSVVIYDQVFGQEYNCIQSMTRTLEELGYEYTLYTGPALPPNLNTYDLVIIPLGADGCG